MGDRDGNVELAEATTEPSLSARISRCRVVRRDDSTNVKSPSESRSAGRTGRFTRCVVYMARLVATLENCGNMSYIPSP